MLFENLMLWFRSDGLHAPEGSRRLKAVFRLPNRPAARVASLLTDMLQDPIEDIRAAAATRLGALKAPRTVAPLVQLLLRERDRMVHDAVTAALASLPADEWLPLLIKAMDDPDFKVSDSASAALRSIGWDFLDDTVRGKVAVLRCDWALAAQLGTAAVPALQATLRTGTAVLRRDAADALCKIADPSAQKAIVDVLRDRRVEPGAREVAAWALRSLHWHEVNPVDAARAAIALGRWPEAAEIGAEAVQPLSIALKDPNVNTRRLAAQTLGTIGDREAAEALAAALVDQGQYAAVRVAAVEELTRIGGEYVVSFLSAALSDKEWSVRAAAARALDELAWKPSRPWDRALYAIAKQRVPDAAAIGAPAIPALVEALRFAAVNAEIGAALVGMGKEGTEALAAISNNPKTDLALREAASTALASVGDARAVEPLHTMLKDADPAVRHSAVWALERLGWKPSIDADRAIVALVHEDWTSLSKMGYAAVEPLIRRMTSEGGCSQTAETLVKIFETTAGRISIDQLRRITRLADGPASDGASSNTATLTRPEVAKLVKVAKYELLRRGITK